MSEDTLLSGLCPVMHAEDAVGPDYVTYARMDDLHDLAMPRTDSPRELTFILVSHVKELLFRVVYVEAAVARDQLRADRPDDACASLARAVTAQRQLGTSWQMLTSMAADEFLTFRHILGTASGTQSFMYRTLEFALGNKDPRMIEASRSSLELFPTLNEELNKPSLYDEALRFLARQPGISLPDSVFATDPQSQYEPSGAVEAAWLQVYRDPTRWPAAHRLAEALIELSYQFSLWRANHLLVVERMLGNKPGTGGTTGLDWLRSISEHRFFPELWSVRTHL